MTHVADALREAIIEQRLRAGARLNQVHIAEQLGVSRMPVREAIATLTAEGLVEPLPAGGVAVKPLSLEDTMNVYDVRIALETEAVRKLISERPSASKQLDRVLASHKQAIPHYETTELLKVDRLFHRTILESTGNPFFVRALVPLWSVVERVMFTALQQPEIISTVWEEHEAIASAIRRGDSEEADALIRNHLGHGSAAISVMLKED